MRAPRDFRICINKTIYNVGWAWMVRCGGHLYSGLCDTEKEARAAAMRKVMKLL